MTRIPTDPEQIRQLAVIMADHGLTEVELTDKDTRIRVVRATSQVGASPQLLVSSGHPSKEPATRQPMGVPDDQIVQGHPGSVSSPMVGVAFLAPEPGAPNFVSIGQRVEVGQTLLLIEAMKTFNPVRATVAGTVAKIIVQNNAPVEYGELLMIIE